VNRQNRRIGVMTLTAAVAAFAALGIGSASGSPGAPPSQNDKKVTVCHNKHTISISKNALKAHLAIGDKLGPCQQSTNTTQSPHAQNASTHAGTPGSAGAANAQGNGKGKGKS
jgi:hypothetical protein